MNIKILDSRIGKSDDMGGCPMPEYATAGAAAFDLRAMIHAPLHIVNDYQQHLIPTGIAIHIDNEEVCGLIFPRSGIAHKCGIVLGNSIGLIDSDYQGQLFVSLRNRSADGFTVHPMERIAQMMFTYTLRPAFEVVEEFEASKRGSGGFGHTGRK